MVFEQYYSMKNIILHLTTEVVSLCLYVFFILKVHYKCVIDVV